MLNPRLLLHARLAVSARELVPSTLCPAQAHMHDLCPPAAPQGNRSAHRTLRAWEVDVLSKASYWEQCRRQRLADYEDLQVGGARE